MLEKKVFWHYYVELEQINGQRVGIKICVHLFKFSAIVVTLSKKNCNWNENVFITLLS